MQAIRSLGRWPFCARGLMIGGQAGHETAECHRPLRIAQPTAYPHAMNVLEGAAEVDLLNDLSTFGGAGVTSIDARSILTSTSGFMSGYKFTLNPYGGCGFGCGYCYARFFAPSAGQREDWGR